MAIKTKCCGCRRRVANKVRHLYNRNTYDPLKEEILELKTLIEDTRSPRSPKKSTKGSPKSMNPEELRLKRLL